MSPALDSLLRALEDVEDLQEIHRQFTGGNVGRPTAPVDLEVLSRSAIVLCVAMWQDYLEDAVRKASQFIIGAASCPDDLPEGLRKKVAYQLRESVKDDANLLDLFSVSGDGYKAKATAWIEKVLEDLNTPNSGNSADLLVTCLGVEPDFENMRWANMKLSAADKLNALLKRRHDIAHHGRTGRRQWKSQAGEDLSFVRNLGRQVDALIANRLTGLPGVTW